jgi:hypothetical protein
MNRAGGFMSKQLTVTMDAAVIRSLTESYLIKKVTERRAAGPSSFTLPDLIGSDWPAECKPFYGLYGNDKTAGCEMGKLLGQVGRKLGLHMKREDKYGKKDAITRYFV